MLGLYIHVPFCLSICHYCNFNRGLHDDALRRRYVEAAVREIRGAPGRHGWRAGAQAADTVFFGGGTPSLLDGGEVGDVLAACGEAFAIAAGAEVTLEANPDTVTPPRLAAWRHAGVNRLSLGVQSFRDDELRRLGRIHDAARARQAVADARAAGIDNLSLDLMMWLPGQTVSQWIESVQAAIDAGPDHLSLYILELYPHAPLRVEMARAGISLPPDDDAAEMYEQAMATLERAGYRQYEISNVARPGRESRHNLKYWRDGEWLGFGPGAHSTLAGQRWKNLSATEVWAARVASGASVEEERHVLTPVERWQEALITGLRLVEGIDVQAFQSKFGLDLDRVYGNHLQPYEEEGLVTRTSGRIRLTRRGMLVANEVLLVFIHAGGTLQ